MAYGFTLRIVTLLAGLAALFTAQAAPAQQVRISRLTDVAIGSISNFTTDIVRSQNVCAHSTAASNRYSVTARGSGTGNAFTLASGTARLAYEVQWAGAIGQTSGTNLVTGVAQGGFTGRGNTSTCGNGVRTASLIVILRAAQVSAATAGTYSGVLTLILAPN